MPVMERYDIVILTDPRCLNPERTDLIGMNAVKEDGMLKKALEARGFTVTRTNWDNPGFDWTGTGYILFRTTWDYFDRYSEFNEWLERVKSMTRMINPYGIIRWNLDKHYLGDLAGRGINIPPTIFIEKGDGRTLTGIIQETGWKEAILKPAISGAARHTYRMSPEQAGEYEPAFRDLIAVESMLLQEFQHRVIHGGEATHMMFDGKYSHSVLKRPKKGDFRVQDDYGGTVEVYNPDPGEIEFAEKAMAACRQVPVYGRVDVIRDNRGEPCVSELELIEPELWFRTNPQATGLMARAVEGHIERTIRE